MSRTRCKPVRGSLRSYTNRYTYGISDEDLRLLNEPCPPFVPKHFLEKRTYHDYHLERYTVPYSFHDGKRWHTYDQDRYRRIPYTYTRWFRVENPEYDPELASKRWSWLYAHHYIYRGGFSRRQRLKAIRKEKQLAHGTERMKLKKDLRRKMREYFEE